MLRYAQDAYNSREERRNKEFVALCLRNFTDNEPMLSPEQELELVKKLDATITLADINNEARNLISNKNQVATIFASEKDGFKLPSKEAIEKTILDAQAKNYAAYTEEKLPETLISKLPKKGNIVSEKDSKFGYKELTLSNGMKVYVKSTKYEPDAISMRMFSEGGTSIYPDSDMVNLSYLISGVTAGGVGKFNNIQLDQMLAGKTASARPYIEGLEEGINGTSNKASLKTMLELTYLYFTSPRRDDAAFKSLMNRQYTFLANRDASPNVAYKDSITAILYGNNPRLAPVKQASLKHVNYDRIMQIYKERFADASDFRVVFTGDIDLDQLRPLLCQYLASLPSAGKKEQYVDRHEYMLRANEKHIFKKEQKTPSSLSNIFISVPMEYTAENDLKLSVLSQLLRIDYTEKVREEKGGTYGVSVSGSMSKDPREEAIMRINFRTDPAKYDELIPIIYQCLDDMAKNGPTQENLNKIKEYERKTYGQMKVINNYYDYLIYNYLTDGIDFDTDYVKKVDSLTIESIRDFAKRIFSPGNHVEITMQPEK
jgi:zinc protease